MDFSSLILMERDSETGFVTREIGSFPVSEGAKYIKSFYVQGENVFIKFDTYDDVEEWQYTAIYDLFDYTLFEKNDMDIEDVEDTFNPTFLIKFNYDDNFEYLKGKLDLSIDLIEQALNNVFKEIEGKEEEYN